VTRRNFRFTYWLFSSISLVILVTSIVLTVRIGNDKRLPFFLADLNLYTEYFFLDSPIGMQFAGALECCFLVFAATFMLIAVLFTFQKTVSAEIYLIALWIFLVEAEALRLPMLIIAQRSTHTGSLISLTRLIYGARFSGLISLFISGLYAVGIGKERPQTGCLLALLLGSVFAMLLPISTDRFQSSFMLQAGYSELTIIVTASLIVLNAIDYFVAARQKEEKSYVFVGITLTVAASSWVWLWNTRDFKWGLIVVIAFGLCIFASIKILHYIYIWK